MFVYYTRKTNNNTMKKTVALPIWNCKLQDKQDTKAAKA